MKAKALCPVCRVSFSPPKTPEIDETLVCPVCGARLSVTSVKPDIITVMKFPQEPRDEIIDRIENFAQQRNLQFDEDRETVLEGLLEKKQKHNDFFCPCKLENTPENICPCTETRMGYVTKNGSCY